MPKSLLNGVGIYYQQAGRGADLVLIHGLAANLAFWYIKILPLLVRNFRVTIFDLRGHGYSDMPPSNYTARDMAQDLLALFEVLGISKAHVVGHSFGGLVALHFSVLYPDRVNTLTVADTRVSALQPVPKLKDWPYWQLWQRTLASRGVYLDDEQEIDFGLLEQLARRRRLPADSPRSDSSFFVPFEVWNAGQRSAQRWLKLLNTTTAREDFKAQAGLTLNRICELERPTLAIYGQYSFCLPSCHGLQENLPDCRTVLVRRAGHFHPIVRPRIFLKCLGSFLATQRVEQV
jgi:pimeloyl-ACP methyl ester carboxylesterase